jgi:CRP-like cAMP-binding protein
MKMFNPEEVLFQEGEVISGIFIVLRGSVLESHVSNGVTFDYEHQTGSVVGIQHALKHIEHNITSAYAKTMVYVGYLSLGHLEKLMTHINIEELLWRAAAIPLIMLNYDAFKDILVELRKN